MTWLLTQSLGDFTAAASDYLQADPVTNTVPLTVLAALRENGPSTFGDDPPLFGWHESVPGEADGAFLQTSPFPVFVAGLPPASANALVALLAGRMPTQANLPEEDAAEFGAAWTSVTGGSTAVHRRMRLFRLDSLVRPDQVPSGAARIAGKSDFDLLASWTTEFVGETDTEGDDAARTVADRLSYGAITIWEDGGIPVAMASLTRHVAGVCRISSVYTPGAHRQRGYGGAVTTAVTERALAGGASAVVLYTDVANPASNALYQRLGFRPVSDRIALDLR